MKRPKTYKFTTFIDGEKNLGPEGTNYILVELSTYFKSLPS